MIKQMWVNKNDQIEECFLAQDTQQTHSVPSQEIWIDISQKIYQQLPANQLITARRPQTMAARTFFLQRPFYQLKSAMSDSCIQSVTATEEGKLKLKIANSNNLGLQQYFLKKKFKCVYNKLQTYRNDAKSFQGRFKGIDSLIDYNWKCFKQLELQQKTSRIQMEDRIDSDFQCGNICRAYVNVDELNEYYLVIENDVNTYGYNNWFFFRLRNKEKGKKRFTIVNLIKKTNFFNLGMLISIFSQKKHRYQNYFWFKGGDKVTFGNINFVRNHHVNDHYSSLSFQYNCQYDNDEVYFALNQPYTYSRLISFLKNVQSLPKVLQMQTKVVGYSISNNIIPVVRFSKPQDSSANRTNQTILILARQHPCETTGSFIAQKLINLIIQQDAISNFLTSQFQFYIVPMVNPDGVIHGMARCNMAGFDLNRQWGDNIIKELTPETVKIKQFIANLSKTKNIKYMIDLHGHGKKLNSFFFSCKGNEKQNIRLFSMAMKKIEPRFNLYGCTYGITKDKENTIRSRVNSMGISHSYTLQTSLYGWKDQQNKIHHFNEEDYKSIAFSLLRSIFIIEANPKITLQIMGLSKEEIVNEMKGMIDKIGNEEEQNYDNNDVLSDSDPEGDKLDVKILLGNCQNKLIKKKIQEQYQKTKKTKTKKSKQIKNLDECCKISNKNMRQSCPSGLDIKGKLSKTHQALLSKDIHIKSDFKTYHNKKISFTEKWQERRKQIEKKKRAEQGGIIDDDARKTMTRLDLRKRIKTQIQTNGVKKAHLPYSTFSAKRQYSNMKGNNQKIKTQIEQMNSVSQQQIQQNEIRRSALEIKFKELKQQSLNVLLTDTLSISKIASDKEKLMSPEGRLSKNCSIKIKKEHLLTEPIKSQTNSKMATVDESNAVQKDSIRYKKFRQFLNSGLSSKKMQKSTNSVFYYFPIL